MFLLPGLLTIAEIHIIEGRLKKAEEYLNAAHWSFLKNNDKTEINKKAKEKSLSLTKEYVYLVMIDNNLSTRSLCIAHLLSYIKLRTNSVKPLMNLNRQ